MVDEIEESLQKITEHYSSLKKHLVDRWLLEEELVHAPIAKKKLLEEKRDNAISGYDLVNDELKNTLLSLGMKDNEEFQEIIKRISTNSYTSAREAFLEAKNNQ